MATGTTSLGMDMSGRLTRQRARHSILMAMGTGCGRRVMGISGFQAIRGAICRTSAEHGITMAASAGVGRQGQEDAHRGGDRASTAVQTLAICRPAIESSRGRFCRAARSVAIRCRWLPSIASRLSTVLRFRFARGTFRSPSEAVRWWRFDPGRLGRCPSMLRQLRQVDMSRSWAMVNLDPATMNRSQGTVRRSRETG